MGQLPEHVEVNRAHWDHRAAGWVAGGEHNWALDEPVWGIWGTPESRLRLLPEDMRGIDAIELGCGTAYVCGWMARRGARVVGVDVSRGQLRTARRLAADHGVALTLVQANAEDVPFPDESFDFAISEYGAAVWCDPYAWIPEAHRLLRPGGELVFLSNSTLSVVCSPSHGSPVGNRLERDYFSIHRLDWRQSGGGIEFNLPISGWFRLLTRTGFEVLDFFEVQAPDGGTQLNHFVTGDWAHRFPSEQGWRARKRG